MFINKRFAVWVPATSIQSCSSHNFDVQVSVKFRLPQLAVGVFDLCCVGPRMYWATIRMTSKRLIVWFVIEMYVLIPQASARSNLMKQLFPQNSWKQENLGRNTWYAPLRDDWVNWVVLGFFRFFLPRGRWNLFYKPILYSSRWIIHENPLRLNLCQGLQLLGEDMNLTKFRWCDFLLLDPNVRRRNFRSFKFG